MNSKKKKSFKKPISAREYKKKDKPWKKKKIN